MKVIKQFTFLLLLLVFCWIDECYAVTQYTRYVRTDCANNGDGTASSCASSGGAAGAYKTLNQALTGEVQDYTATDKQLELDVSGATAETACITLSNYATTTDATRYVRVFTATGNHPTGVGLDTAHYRIDCTSSTAAFYMNSSTFRHIRLEGIQVKNVGVAGSGEGIYLPTATASGSDVRLFHNVITGTVATTHWGIRDEIPGNGGTNARIYIVGNIIYGYDRQMVVRMDTGGKRYVYSNTMYCDGGNYGISSRNGATAGDFLLTNNIAYNCATSDFDDSSTAAPTADYNLSKDATVFGTHKQSAATVTFVNTGTKDFHLGSSDTGATAKGTSLAADSNYAFTTDVDYQTISGTWPIGADQYQSGSADVGLNLRDTSGYCTDPANTTYLLDADTYPTAKTTNGKTFNAGWDANLTGGRDRTTGVDCRLSGMAFRNNTGTQAKLTIDLTNLGGAGTYDIHLGATDQSFDQYPLHLEIYDNTTLKQTIDIPVFNVPQVVDGSGTPRASAAAWVSGEVATTITFASATLNIKMGTTTNAGGNSVLSHVRIVTNVAGAGGGSTNFIPQRHLHGLNPMSGL